MPEKDVVNLSSGCPQRNIEAVGVLLGHVYACKEETCLKRTSSIFQPPSDPLRLLDVAQHLTESHKRERILTKGLGVPFGSHHDGSPV